MIKKIKGSLFAKIFVITFLLTSICCVLTYTVISWLVPKTYSTTLDTNLENTVTSFITELEAMSPLESGKLFDEFLLNNNGVLLQLFDTAGNELELPSQGSTEFPRLLTGGIATENADPAAYRATHSYLFSFTGSDTVYTLTVAGSAHEVDLLKDTLASVFLILFFLILAIATIASVVYSRYVTKPVLRLSEVSKEMSELNFNWKCKEDRTDELGVLAHSLNEMSMKLSAALENLQNANAKLQADIEHERELEQAQLDFFSAVSHELKTPLTAISGYAELMENGMVPPEEIGSFAQKIEKNARRLLSLINDIIRLSELDSSNTQLLVEKFDLFEEAQICVENMQIYAEKNDVTITYEGGHQEITANREMINELINNLCANAIRYNKKNGSVKVRVDSSQGHPYISVADTGIGISKEHQKRVFERFYRVDKSRSKQTGGTGLGLAIVKHIVALHDAQLNLESEVGKGTTITVTF